MTPTAAAKVMEPDPVTVQAMRWWVSDENGPATEANWFVRPVTVVKVMRSVADGKPTDVVRDAEVVRAYLGE